MAKKVFYSGRLKLSVSFNDRTDQYQVRVCPMDKGERCETVTVGQPGSGPRSRHGKRISVDDPRAMRDAAHAAISHSKSGSDYADYNRRGSGFLIRPARRGKRR